MRGKGMTMAAVKIIAMLLLPVLPLAVLLAIVYTRYR
jgi:hypothetical protein